MAELRGLLDSAKRKIGGLLGDFPAGFNSGAVAGIAGYPGDIAYMLDTAGRAITGQDTQPAAQDFPGTTDYIAAKAGYPIPGSFSGQLGAAVGGMLTPGPGDLAKFAPVLSAIPFWHGSPHKYDAVDLSKIGTGEGAQAYGHGYYGGQAKETGEEYARTLSNIDRDTGYASSHLNAQNVVARTNGDQEWAAEVVADQLSRTEPSDSAYGKLADTLEIIKSGKYKEPLPDSGYLYRGEYRWPDPAKEAATPLTGEDLLQWDRPLSEQPESFRDALIGLPEIQARISASERQRVKLNELHPARIGKIPSADKPIDASRITGDEVISTLRQSGLSEADVSKKLLEMGIPGIRYLDGMSRTDGTGTYNYVMFDDKGIKLLERNGTPIEDFAARRAGKAKPYKDAMRVLYRGTTGSDDKIIGGIAEGALFAAAKEGVAKSYAGTGGSIERIGVSPDAKILVEGSPEFASLTKRRRGKLINTLRNGENLKTAADDVARLAKAAGYDAIEFTSMDDLGVAIFNPDKFYRNLP